MCKTLAVTERLKNRTLWLFFIYIFRYWSSDCWVE